MMSNDELRLMLKAKREWARRLGERISYRVTLLNELGIDRRKDVELHLMHMLAEQTGYEIKTICEELARREAQSLTKPVAKVQLKQDSRDSIDRMMRGNFNKYGGEEV